MKLRGGGIILESIVDERSMLQEHIRRRETAWEKGVVSPGRRETRFHHKSKFILVTGSSAETIREIATSLEERLFEEGFLAYYLGIASLDHGLDSDVLDAFEQREERLRRLGELARILTDSGQIFITSLTDLDPYDRELLRSLNAPNEVLVVNVGLENRLGKAESIEVPQGEDTATAVNRIGLLLKQKDIIPDYSI